MKFDKETGKMNFFFHIIFIICCSASIKAQNCPAIWATNGSNCNNNCGISLATEGGKVPDIPNNGLIKTTGGSEINFSVRFTDPDIVIGNVSSNCINTGSAILDVRDKQYSVKFETDNPAFSSFDPVVQMAETIKNSVSGSVTHADPNDPLLTIFGINGIESPATLYIANNWGPDDAPIVVTATIFDITLVPAGDGGVVQDDPLSDIIWTLNYLDVCPQGLERVYPPVAQNIPLAPDQLNATYRGIPNLPGTNPDYEGVPVNEKFERDENGKLKYEVFFTESDLSEKYLSKNGIVTAIDYAQQTFRLGNEETLIFTSNDKIVDSHKPGFFDEKGSFYKRHVKKAFKKSSMQSNKVGFSINQDYFCILTPNSLGSATVMKRWTYLGSGNNYKFEVGKNHQF